TDSDAGIGRVHRASTHVSTIRNLQMAPQASYSCSRFGKDALVVGLVGGDDVVGAEFFLGVNAGRFAHVATAVRAWKNLDGVACRRLNMAWVHQIAIHAMP